MGNSYYNKSSLEKLLLYGRVVVKQFGMLSSIPGEQYDDLEFAAQATVGHFGGGKVHKFRLNSNTFTSRHKLFRR